MADPDLQIEYNRDLEALTKVLAGVKRPGEFYAAGLLVTPLPRLEIEGVGTISFPVPAAQAKEIIQLASPAPYGKGEETVIDPKVRKVWQIAPAKLRLSGSAWAGTLETIVTRVAQGLGCPGSKVRAELYKLLIYDVGSFFVSHRDTEKAEGMFGTLVVVLPSLHRGGELVVRHAGREVTLEMTTTEVSELSYAAFYADCEHEVRPVTEGYRLCLIYNLNLAPSAKGARKALTAPDHRPAIEPAAKLLADWAGRTGTPPKLVYLLEHQYTPAALSFAGLKNADAALGKVMAQAAQQAGYAVHLGIVHIEESGAAELTYAPRRSRWGHRYDEDDEEGEEADEEDFEVVDVCEERRFVSDWVDVNDHKVDFGAIPLGEGELLPAGALDGEPPDEQRVTEATGNEGASFDRAYHRAALVLWPETRYPEVLLQAGPEAVVPYLNQRISEWQAASGVRRTELWPPIASLAARVIAAWETKPAAYGLQDETQIAKREKMFALFRRMGHAGLVAQFIEQVLAPRYQGSENASLAATAPLLGPEKTASLISALVERHLPFRHAACVDLLQRLVKKLSDKSAPQWRTAYRTIAQTAVRALGKIKVSPYDYSGPEWWLARDAKPVEAGLVVGLWEVLGKLAAPELEQEAVAALIDQPKIFIPDTALVPALAELHQTGPAMAHRPSTAALWQHCAEYLLARGETPPRKPTDWAQPVELSCACQDCRELAAFARDPVRQVHRFAVRKDRRQHLHGMIERHGLDMTHQTERIGSPQTLVCTKTRLRYQRQCEQYAHDLKSLQSLLEIATPPLCPGLQERVQAALRRGKVAS